MGKNFARNSLDMVPDMLHVSVMCPFLTLDPDELQQSVRGQIGVEFCQVCNGHGNIHKWIWSWIFQLCLSPAFFIHYTNFSKFRTNMF